MGYTTKFYGEIKVTPALNEQEQKFIEKFANTRRVIRNYPNQGKYFLSDGTDGMGQFSSNTIDNNTPPEGQPGLWCKWTANEKGNIQWNNAEKFYSAEEWMVYLIEHFFKQDAFMKRNETETYQKNCFQEHNLNGVIYAKGEEPGDVWKLIVSDNEVFTSKGQIKQEVIFEGSKAPVRQNMTKDETYEMLYNIWYDLEILNDNMATWEMPQKIIYTPSESELGGTQLGYSNLKRLGSK